MSHNTSRLPRSHTLSVKGGFTIVELMVTIGIFVVITGLTLARYRSFNINADFSNTIEDVVIALREAQVYGAGGKGNATCGGLSVYDCSYGVHFALGSSYNIFVDNNGSNSYDGGDTVRESKSLAGGATITSISCATAETNSGIPYNCINGYVDIMFKRPSPDAFISETPVPTFSDDKALVTIKNADSSKTATITITCAGQMALQVQ